MDFRSSVNPGLPLPGLEPLPAPSPASRYPLVIANMSAEELRVEWLQQEHALIAYDRLIDGAVDALFGEEHAECTYGDGAPAGDDLVSGINSLHELNGRLMDENERLRARVAELEKLVRS